MSLSDPNRGRLATSTGDMLWYSGRDLVPWYGVLVEKEVSKEWKQQQQVALINHHVPSEVKPYFQSSILSEQILVYLPAMQDASMTIS